MDIEIKKVLEELDIKYNNIVPIGNHDLGRHLVYRINTLHGSKVIKLYNLLKSIC